MNLMVTIDWKPIIDTQEIKRNKSKYNTKETHPNIGGECKRIRKEQRRTARTINKMAINTYLPIKEY